MKTNNDRYRPGDWLYECPRSAKWCYASETVKEARTGLRVHKDWADPVHPQERVRGVYDDMSVPFASPPVGVFLDEGTDAAAAGTPMGLSLVFTRAVAVEASETAVTFTHGDNFIDPINDPVTIDDL